MSNKLKAATTSIVINLTLLTSKIIAAYITGSIALIAECAHSLFDMVASILAYVGIKKAEQPEDHTHLYGHEKFENLSSLLQALLITGTAFIIMWEAYKKFSEHGVVENSGVGIILMMISIPITFLTARYLSSVAKKEGGSQALEADSAHFTTDVLGSIAVLTGLILVKFGFPFGDPLAAFTVGIIMLYISIELGLHSFYVFMDFSPDASRVKLIEDVLKKAMSNKKIDKYHKLRARMAGSKILLEFHIHISPNLTVKEGHDISSAIKAEIRKAVPEVKDATIHIEPA
ncbi:MAG: cation diffusion facilitator family transporter [Candidatus Woesearchaeota archaeon]|jgi:cation diffusion facilitator family transporter